jgi:hypothetical protein
VTLALDPPAPIRYRGLALFPTGMPVYLADMMLKEEPTQIFSEILNNKFAETWLSHQTDKRPDSIAADSVIAKGREVMQSNVLGSGIERTLYEMNPTLPCLSPLVRDRYAMTVKQVLEALDRKASMVAPSPLPTIIDRHIAAFFLARDKRILPKMVHLIDNPRDPVQRNIAIISLLADIQYRFGPESLKGLASSLLAITGETVKRFHHRPRQEKVSRELKIAAEAGDINKMLKLLDDLDIIAEDNSNFAAAKLLYAETQKEIERMTIYAQNKKGLAQMAGHPLAAVISVLCGFFALAAMLFNMFRP